MGLFRNAIAQKLRSGFEPGKRLGNRIVELYKMRPSSTAYVAVHGSYSCIRGAFSTRMYFILDPGFLPPYRILSRTNIEFAGIEKLAVC